jgi:hypothetical protein
VAAREAAAVRAVKASAWLLTAASADAAASALRGKHKAWTFARQAAMAVEGRSWPPLREEEEEGSFNTAIRASWP